MVDYLLYLNYLIKNTFYFISIFLYFMLFLFLILYIYIVIIVFLKELQHNFSLLYEKTAYKRFKEPDSEEYIKISLFYKIYSLPLTMLESFFYFILVLGSILFLRILRLDTVIDLYQIYYKINYLSPITKLFLILVVILYLYLLKLYIDTFASRMYYGLKRLYIYLLQVGGRFDIDSYKKGTNRCSYIEDYFANPISKIDNLALVIYKLYKNPVPRPHSKDKRSLYKYYTQDLMDGMPLLSLPFFYFMQLSKYSNSRIVLVMKKGVKLLNKNLWTFIYVTPICLISYTIFYEYYYKDGLLSNIYYIFILVFIYKIYLDLAYFFTQSSCSEHNKALCIYYYVFEKLHPAYDKDAGQNILSIYLVYTTKEQQGWFEIYLKTHLNAAKMRAEMMGEEYTNQYSDKINVRIKKKLIESPIFQILYYFLESMTLLPYDIISFKISWETFKDSLYSISSRIAGILLSNIFIAGITLGCLYVFSILPIHYLLVFAIPLGFIYTIKIIKNPNIVFTKLIMSSYFILIALIYLCHTKHYNILYMDETLWDFGVEILQQFTIQEKIRYFEEYLHYLTYSKNNTLNPHEKREFLKLIDVKHLKTLITETTTLSELKQLAYDCLEIHDHLMPKKLYNRLLKAKELDDDFST